MGIIGDVKQFLSAYTIPNSARKIEEIDRKRTEYLEQVTNTETTETKKAIEHNLGAIGVEVYLDYLNQLSKVYSPLSGTFNHFEPDNRVRYFEITKWVTDTDEKSLDKLVNVYHVLNGEDCNVALIYHRTKDRCSIILGIVNTNPEDSDPSVADKYYSRVVGAIQGNFPGSVIRESGAATSDYGVGIPECLRDILETKLDRSAKSVVAVSNIASEKSEGFVSQSMEKLLDGIVPQNDQETYTVVLLAKPIRDLSQYKNRLFELYTALSPYAAWQSNYQFNESDIETNSEDLGFNASLGFSFYATGNFGASFARASSTAVQIGKSEGTTKTVTNYGVKHTLEIIEAQLKRIEESTALGMWEFASYIISENPVVANNVAHMYLALTQGETSFLSSAAVNFWDGDIDTESAKTILTSVQKLQHPVFNRKPSYGEDWQMYPTLVTATTPITGRELAKALNFPRKSVSGIPVLEVVPFGREPQTLFDSVLDLDIGCGYHMRKERPEQRIRISKEELTKHTFIAGSTGSGKSNTIYKILENLGKDIPFLVVEPAKGEYKREIGQKKGVITYGTNPVIRDMYLLKINPFRFPPHTHVLEHIDRLVELFNVCWPMYAAMPAILKDAVVRAYAACGWNLETSDNRYDQNLFPSFSDVERQIKEVLNESEYSQENKGDYIGSLVTRLHSLTNGINGLLFTSDDLKDEELFDRNVIVDLSRVGSSETKALIMGLLVLKLLEHRMEQSIKTEPNEKLKHITVLEEAHNLLKRTSSTQSSESSNLLGKSVEMLANAIAEMRTYGEGFIIADQSPGMMDKSVIRNTNTKIILRLPDYTDRELVGRASGLNDNQIVELAKLGKGVAAVSQSDWLEPVLCQVDQFTGRGEPFFKPSADGKSSVAAPEGDETASLLDYIMTNELYRKGDRVDLPKLKNAILRSRLDSSVKCDFLDYLTESADDAFDALRKLIYDFLHAEDAIKTSKDCKDIHEWVHSVVEKLYPPIVSYSNQQIDLVIALLVYEQSLRDVDYENVLCRFAELHRTKGGVY